MTYGKNLLSQLEADWTFANGSYSNATLVIGSNGSAATQINTAAITQIPAQIQLDLIPNIFTSTYAPDLTVTITISYTDETKYQVVVPIIQVPTGKCRVIIKPYVGACATISFVIANKSASQLVISSWMLRPLLSAEDKITWLIADGTDKSDFTTTDQFKYNATEAIIALEIADTYVKVTTASGVSTIDLQKDTDGKITQMTAGTNVIPVTWR